MKEKLHERFLEKIIFTLLLINTFSKTTNDKKNIFTNIVQFSKFSGIFTLPLVRGLSNFQNPIGIAMIESVPERVVELALTKVPDQGGIFTAT